MWQPLHSFGFVYYESYTPKHGVGPVAWITRSKHTKPYEAFYCDGKHIAGTTRGSMKNARAFVAALLKKYGTA